jgi:hexosaminidase
LVKTVPSPVPPREAGPLAEVFVAKDLNVRARCVRVHARNLARIPGWHPAAGQKAWLFADELMVNPSPRGVTGEKHPEGKDSKQ